MTLDGSDESYRASKLIKSLEIDYPTKFLKFINHERHETINSKTISPAEALSIISEDNLKVKQVHTINVHLKAITSERATFKEDNITEVVVDIDIVDLIVC